MSRVENRIRRIEEKANSAGGKQIAFCWLNGNEDPEELKEKFRQEHPGENLIVYLVSWASEGTWPIEKPQPEPQRAASEIDREIENIVSDLEGEGYSLEQIAGMVQEEKPVIPEPEKAPQYEEAIEPRRAEDLTRLFSARRRR